jgi:hypothetical protein
MNKEVKIRAFRRASPYDIAAHSGTGPPLRNEGVQWA